MVRNHAPIVRARSVPTVNGDNFLTYYMSLRDIFAQAARDSVRYRRARIFATPASNLNDPTIQREEFAVVEQGSTAYGIAHSRSLGKTVIVRGRGAAIPDDVGVPKTRRVLVYDQPRSMTRSATDYVYAVMILYVLMNHRAIARNKLHRDPFPFVDQLARSRDRAYRRRPSTRTLTRYPLGLARETTKYERFFSPVAYDTQKLPGTYLVAFFVVRKASVDMYTQPFYFESVTVNPSAGFARAMEISHRTARPNLFHSPEAFSAMSDDELVRYAAYELRSSASSLSYVYVLYTDPPQSRRSANRTARSANRTARSANRNARSANRNARSANETNRPTRTSKPPRSPLPPKDPIKNPPASIETMRSIVAQLLSAETATNQVLKYLHFRHIGRVPPGLTATSSQILVRAWNDPRPTKRIEVTTPPAPTNSFDPFREYMTASKPVQTFDQLNANATSLPGDRYGREIARFVKGASTSRDKLAPFRVKTIDDVPETLVAASDISADTVFGLYPGFVYDRRFHETHVKNSARVFAKEPETQARYRKMRDRFVVRTNDYAIDPFEFTDGYLALPGANGNQTSETKDNHQWKVFTLALIRSDAPDESSYNLDLLPFENAEQYLRVVARRDIAKNEPLYLNRVPLEGTGLFPESPPIFPQTYLVEPGGTFRWGVVYSSNEKSKPKRGARKTVPSIKRGRSSKSQSSRS